MTSRVGAGFSVVSFIQNREASTDGILFPHPPRRRVSSLSQGVVPPTRTDSRVLHPLVLTLQHFQTSQTLEFSGAKVLGEEFKVSRFLGLKGVGRLPRTSVTYVTTSTERVTEVDFRVAVSWGRINLGHTRRRGLVSGN